MPRLFDESDERFELRPSTIPGAGLGLFARTDLPLGTMFEVIGALIRREGDSDRCSHFADHHKFRIGPFLLIPLGFGGMVNHADDPNLEKVFANERLFFRVTRPLRAGEELTFRYPDAALERFGITPSK